MNQENPRFSGQSGNALWFLLVAIALLAALTITITRSSDSADQNANVELSRIQASQILRYAKGLEQAVNQMQTRNISANDISFADPGLTGYTNPNCTTDDCKLFKSKGGGQSYVAPSDEWLDGTSSPWIFTGKLCVQGVGDQTEAIATDCSTNTDGSDEDLVMLLPHVRKGLCIELNKMLGVTNPSGNPPADTGDAWAASPEFVGTFADGANIGVNNAGLYRKASGCIEGAGTPASGTYVFYHVLLAR